MADWYECEPQFNFDKNEFVTINGIAQTVTGKEALKNWIAKILHTPKDRYKVYEGTGYGTRIEELIVGHTLPQGYVMAEVEREVKETLLKHESITNVDSFDIAINDNVLTISFRVTSDFGSFTINEVNLNG